MIILQMNNYKYTNIKQKRHFNLDVFKNEIASDFENKNNFDPFLNIDYVKKYHNQFEPKEILKNLK